MDDIIMVHQRGLTTSGSLLTKVHAGAPPPATRRWRSLIFHKSS
jgi:hypothetical protein